MELRETLGRNFNINKEIRKRYDKIQTGFIFKDREAKYIFMLCLALGYINNKRKTLKNPTGLLNTSSFSDDDIWAIAAIAVKTKDMIILNKPSEVKKIASEYAYAGLDFLEELITDYGTGENLELAIEKKAKEEFKEFKKN